MLFVDVLKDEDRHQLRGMHDHTVVRNRAEIILLSAAGISVPEIVRRLDICAKTVRKWIKLFNEHGMEGLKVVIPRKIPYQSNGRPRGGRRAPRPSKPRQRKWPYPMKGRRAKLLLAAQVLDNASEPMNTYEFTRSMKDLGFKKLTFRSAGTFLSTYFWRVGDTTVKGLGGTYTIGLWAARHNQFQPILSKASDFG